MKRKALFTTILALALAVATLLPIGASAVDHPYNFTFNSVNGTQYTENHTKSDTEQHWYVSTHNYAGNTLSSTNVLGVRMHDKNSIGYISNYHTFSRHTGNVRLDYTTYVSNDNGNYFYMGAKKDNSSTSSTPLVISGNFCP